MCHLFSDLWCEFEHQLFQQTVLAVLKDGDFGQSGQMHAHGGRCLKRDREVLKNLALSCDLSVKEKTLVWLEMSIWISNR